MIRFGTAKLWLMAAILAAQTMVAVPSAKAQTLPLDRWKRHVVDAKKPWRSIFIAAADLDGDGQGDIVTGGWWYRNPGSSGNGWQRRVIGAPLNNMAAIFDFDGDGDIDILGTGGKASESNSKFVWARNDGAGAFDILQNIPAGEGDFLQGVAVARFTGELGVALSWHGDGSGIQLLTLPTSPATENWSWSRISGVSQDEQLSAGQIDGQNGPDLLLGTQWLRRQGEQWSVAPLLENLGTPDRNRLADMNHDGRLDAVVGYEAINRLGKLAWYEQPATPGQFWVEHLIGEVIGPMSVDVGDLDKDGDLDVVVGEHNYARPETAKLIVFENQDGRATTWKQHVVHTGDEHHDGAVLTDIDADGDLDIVSIGWKEPEVWLYENLARNPER